MDRYEGMTSIIFCSRESAEQLLSTVSVHHPSRVHSHLLEADTCVPLPSQIRRLNLIQRNILYMFYCELWPPSAKFRDKLLEAMRVAVISNPRPGTYATLFDEQACNACKG